ncbi:MAG: TetR/AcrR family transcriptional regulator [Phascolarctobacterium sp.]
MPRLTEEKKALVDQFIRDKAYKEAKKLLQQHRVTLFTMTELAEQMGVAKGTLYNYFVDKQAVIVYVCKRINEELLAKIQEHIAQQPEAYVENLRYIYRTYIEAMQSNQFMDLASMTLQLDLLKKGVNAQQSTPIYDEIVNKNRRFLLEFLIAGQGAGVFKSYPVESLAAFVSVQFWGIKGYCLAQRTDIYSSRHMRALVEDAEALLLEAICKEPPTKGKQVSE